MLLKKGTKVHVTYQTLDEGHTVIVVGVGHAIGSPTNEDCANCDYLRVAIDKAWEPEGYLERAEALKPDGETCVWVCLDENEWEEITEV